MKNLTHEEFLQAPPKVQFIFVTTISNLRVSMKMLDEAIDEYPEYFQDEIEHRQKWEKIPQSVHDEYWAEREKIAQECYKDTPPSLGFLGFADNPEAYKKWSEAYDKGRIKEKPLIAALHAKTYGKYGIEYTGM